MGTDFRKTALMGFLKDKEPVYWGKVVELRTEVENWLSYIPQTFPHYTRHTVQHSDAILVQLSKLLFRDDSPEQPVVNLSAMETYILVAAAYLHDGGWDRLLNWVPHPLGFRFSKGAGFDSAGCRT